MGGGVGGRTNDVQEIGWGTEANVWPAFLLCKGLGLWGASETAGAALG